MEYLTNRKTTTPEQPEPKKDEKKVSDKIRELMEGKTMTPDQIIEALKNELSAEEREALEKMLASGMAQEDIIDQLLYSESSFKRRMKKMADMDEKELVNLMSQELGAKSKKELDSMLAQGYSLREIVAHFMEHGKSQEEETREVNNKIRSLFRNNDLSKEEMFDMLGEVLEGDQKLFMKRMLEDGFSMQDIINRFTSGEVKPKENMFTHTLNQMTGGKKLKDEEIYNLLIKQLGPESVSYTHLTLPTKA